MNVLLPRTFTRTAKVWLEPATRQYHGSSVVASSSRMMETAQPEPNGQVLNTHFKITLLRSAIGLGDRKKGTLTALGIHRRMQTVYHPHSPECAGKILAVKELVRVENVPAHSVRTKTEQRRERRPSRGYTIVKSLGETGLDMS